MEVPFQREMVMLVTKPILYVSMMKVPCDLLTGKVHQVIGFQNISQIKFTNARLHLHIRCSKIYQRSVINLRQTLLTSVIWNVIFYDMI